MENVALFFKKGLQSEIDYVMIVRAVTLIAMKREVVAYKMQVFRGANVKLGNWRQVTVQKHVHQRVETPCEE